MYATSISDISIPYLHDAAKVLSYRTYANHKSVYRFRSLYIDSAGECSIDYLGKLNEDQIKEVMINFCYPGEDKSLSDINPRLGIDYEYCDGFTEIYTPDGLDYRELKL